jgi:intracellular sulfur oxidation DsrE/DsrF family protein
MTLSIIVQLAFSTVVKVDSEYPQSIPLISMAKVADLGMSFKVCPSAVAHKKADRASTYDSLNIVFMAFNFQF